MADLGEIIRESQIWKSIFRHPAPVDRRNRVVVMLTNFFLHLHPVSIKKQGISLSFTWCMGGVTFFLFLVETVTGVLLTPTGASRARAETGGADRAEPDRPQGLDRAELEVARGEF